MLHSAFWHHSASDLALPFWWGSVSALDRTTGDGGGGKQDHNADNGVLLDFLYPEKTRALIRHISKYGWDTLEGRRRHHMNGGVVRQYSTSPRHMRELESSLNATSQLEQEVEATPVEMTGEESLEQLLAAQTPGEQQLALRLYDTIPEQNRTPMLRQSILAYLDYCKAPVDANRLLSIFNALLPNERTPESYRAAISAYLALEMVGPAVQLHEEAASHPFFPAFGTDILLKRTIKDNQWDLSIRVFKAFLQSPGHNSSKHDSWDLSRTKLVWGQVAELPYLRGNLESFIIHVQQFRHELMSTDDNKAVLDYFLGGFATQTMDHMLKTDPPDEDAIWEFFVGLFREIRALEAGTTYLYKAALYRIIGTERYQQLTNQRKIHLELYQQYRDDCIRNRNPLEYPSTNLLTRLIRHVGGLGSTFGVEKFVQDWHTFYPGKSLGWEALIYLTHYYAELGQAEFVNEYFNEFRRQFPKRVDQRLLSNLIFVYARRADVQGAEEQFKRISEEFGLSPDNVCWNQLLLAYTRADDLDGALACFNRLLGSGMIPDRYTMGPMLDLCAARGDVEAFEALFSKAEQLNIPVRVDAWARAGYVQACLNANDPEGAEAIAEGMLKSKAAGLLQGALTHSWNMLIQYYALRGDLASGQRLYRQMIQNGVPFDSWTFSSLMRGLIEVNQTNAAYKLLRVTMPSLNIPVYAFHYALCITGFIQEKQYGHASRVRKRMLERNIPQTVESRMASLQITAISDLRRLRDEDNSDPRARLIEIEKEIREIMLADYASEVSHRQPRHRRFIDSREHSAPGGYFGFLILLYGTRGAYDICKELFSAAALSARDPEKFEPPVTLLVAIMEAHLRAEEYDEVAKCFDLARSQADKLVKTLQQAMNPSPPKVEFSDRLDESVRERTEDIKIAVSRRQVLYRATRIYVRSLLAQRTDDALNQAQRTMRSLITNGYIIDNLTWNEFIQGLADNNRPLDAFSACEAYLMPAFPGWRTLGPYYTRKNVRGFQWMEIRHTDVGRTTIMPRYKTFVSLAASYARIKRDEANGLGYNADMGGWPSELLEKMCPSTVRAIESMPRTDDRLQKQYMNDMM
jgi:pentatricopeptide repeat-containing protein PET309